MLNLAMLQIHIKEPYGPDDCTSMLPDDQAGLDRVKKVVSFASGIRPPWCTMPPSRVVLSFIRCAPTSAVGGGEGEAFWGKLNRTTRASCQMRSRLVQNQKCWLPNCTRHSGGHAALG